MEAGLFWVLHSHPPCAQKSEFTVQVKCTLFVSGMSKSADESEIKQHFE